MELTELVRIVRRRWLSLALCMLACLAASSALTLVVTPRYTATTQVVFAVEGGQSVTDLAQGSNFAEKQMTTYAQVATSPLVLDAVIRKLDLHTTAAGLAGTIDASVLTNTVILQIAATDTNPQQAAAIANAVGAELSSVAVQLSPEQQSGQQSVRATTLANAVPPTSPSSPHVFRNVLLGLALGLVLGLAIAILRHVLDTKVRSEADIRAVTDTSILGVIAFDDGVPTHPVILREDPRSAAAEAVRRLRTNLQFIGVAQQSRSIVVTSSVPGEGKSTTAINLAVSLADAGARVLLVDADLRRPSVAEYLGLEGRVGLTTVLIGKASVEDVVQPWSDSSLDILPAGQIPPNPSELLGSPAMRALLDQLTSSYDMVLIDSPPVLPVTDAAVLGRQVGGALLVAGMDRIHRPQLRETLESLDTAGCQVLGLVMNKIAKREVGAYVYERGYYSSDAGTDGPQPAVTDGSRPAARV
ncbi:polysaccharide biosynthesis tyrosine autokinase [uncultured Friedmanniella sp.]|uniref:polysaccharide biosynthesis tyrosine autokinase n=1 Tax=uncultured Friedmanniella sp. TaxID=335381 RepID=UPI0035CABFA7